MAIADRVTVLRRGRVTAAGLPTSSTNQAELARLMVGRDVLFSYREEAAGSPARWCWSVEDVSAVNDKGLPALRDVSLTVRAGEIVGVAGVAGNGQSELAEVITGLRQRTSGAGADERRRPITNRPARDAIGRGVAHIPEDRGARGQRAQPQHHRQPDHEELPRAAGLAAAGR